MKKVICLLMVCIIALSAFAGCGNKKEDAEVKLVIGGSGPLTGDYSTYGLSVKNGATIAVEEINAKGGVNGIKLELLMEDDQADPQQAVSAYSKLVDDGMNVSLGCVTSGACIAVTEEAKKDGFLLLTPSGSQLECTQYDNDFRVCFQDPDQGTYSADFIKANEVATKVAIIYEKSNPYSVGIHDTFVAEAEKVGLTIVADEAFTDQSNTDFSVQLQACKASGADLVFLPIYAQECAYIVKQAADAELGFRFMGVDGMDGILEKIGAENQALTNGCILLTPFDASSSDELVASFVSKYQAAYGATPDQFAADAYDAVYAIAAAFEASGCKSPADEGFNEAMIAAMLKIEITGVTGTMTWTADGEPAKTALAVVIQDGAYVSFVK